MAENSDKTFINEYFSGLRIENPEDLRKIQNKTHQNALLAHGHGENSTLSIHKKLQALAEQQNTTLKELIGGCERIIQALLFIIDPTTQSIPEKYKDIPLSKALLNLLVYYTPSEKELQLQEGKRGFIEAAKALRRTR